MIKRRCVKCLQSEYKKKGKVFIMESIVSVGLIGAMSTGEIVGLITFFSILGLFFFVMWVDSIISPAIHSGKILENEDGPNVMRLNRPSYRDAVLVEVNDPDEGSEGSSKKFINLGAHLKTITHKADRKIEKAKILKAAKWYD